MNTKITQDLIDNRIVGHGVERLDEILFNPKNWRVHPKGQQEALQEVLQKVGWVQEVIVNQRTGHLVDGHLRCQVAAREGDTHIPVVYVDLSEEEEDLVLATYDPISAMAVKDADKFAELITSVEELDEDFARMANGITGSMDAMEDKIGDPIAAKSTLAERFIVPPFSVLDARQGYWQVRKKAWLDLGLQPDDGTRDGVLDLSGVNEIQGHPMPTTSIFDPVLAELIVRWFCVPGGLILDPFAGEATKGIVAAYLGYQYTGVELRSEQVEANQEQANKLGLQPGWIVGDSSNLDSLLPEGEQYDLVFTSPPYYDLEIYSQSEKDGSAFETYPGFMDWLGNIYSQAVGRLKENRFVVVKVGEVRDKKTGVYRNFVGDTIACFTQLGLQYYNEAILVTAIGSLPVRAGRQFANTRKLGKSHQNVLVFYKGNPKAIKQEFPEDIEYAEIAEQED